MQSFEGQCILVTGSTRGIGLAVAKRLAAAGAIVGIHGRTAAAATAAATACTAGDRHAIPLAFDLAAPDAGSELVKAFLASTGGRLDGLVNNAGGGQAAPFRAVTAARWRATAAVNVEAVIDTCREAYAIMRRQQSGSIVNVASLAAHGPGKWMGADYAAGKAAVVSLTRSLAFEAARFGIRVNAVSPGFVETDMTRALDAGMRAGLNIPLGRLAAPAEIAAVIVFLLGPDAGYITGQVLHPNGGLHM